jgi:RNA polymerase sigma-54 factor
LDFNIDFNLVRSQKLLLIPQLKQALEILEMNSQELFRYMEEQTEANPVLEMILDDKTGCEYNDDCQEELQPDDTPAVVSLKEHLLLQLKALELDRLRNMVGEYLIDNTDENGYLSADICEVASFFNISSARVCRVLKILQKFDPPGICARNLKECLLLQLRQMGDADGKVIYIVDKHLDKLASNDAQAVSDIMGISLEEALVLFDKVKSLEPRPGREFYDKEPPGPLVADVIVRTMDGRLEALVNDEAFPEVEISGDFILPTAEYADAETDTFIRGNLKDAVWLIKCLEQRKDIILKTAQRLVECQQEFFEKGRSYLKPLSTSHFADRMDMHETILLKALAGKYLQCRWGVFELGYFFDTGEVVM